MSTVVGWEVEVLGCGMEGPGRGQEGEKSWKGSNESQELFPNRPDPESWRAGRGPLAY